MSHIVYDGALHPSMPAASFSILTTRLIIIPSPIAIGLPSFRAMYGSLHAMPSFTVMAFGEAWGVKDWDANTVEPVMEREIQRSWAARGMGDFAVGLRMSGSTEDAEIIRMKGEKRTSSEHACVEWIGYAGVRDATTTSMGNSEPLSHEPSSASRPWQEMIEIRYGFHPDSWGRGYGAEAAKAVMQWCVESRGAKRFIAETEAVNEGSKGILRKLGFSKIVRNDGEELIWGMEGTIEWERWIGMPRSASLPSDIHGSFHDSSDQH